MAQFTKQAIIACFLSMLNETPLDKISVVDIAQRCGINRNTFYYYFTDIYDLVKEVFQMEAQRIEQKNLSYDSWEQVCLETLEFVRENHRVVYHLANSVHRDLLEQYIYDVVFRGMTVLVRRVAADLPAHEDDIQTLAMFYSSAVLGLVTYWILNGLKGDAETMVRRIAGLISGDLRVALERSCRERGTLSGQNPESV